MMRSSRLRVRLVPACLLAGCAWLSGCGQPQSDHARTTKNLAGSSRYDGPGPSYSSVGREIQLRQDGVAVTSLTYDSRVFFDTARDQPRAEAAGVLDAVAARLKREPAMPHVAILGHTDAVGTDAYNLELSRRRAIMVVRELTTRGIDPDMLEPVAVGKRQPVASDATEAGRARNRRVEFLISPSARAIDAVIAARPAGALVRAHPQAGALHAQHPAALHLQVRQPDGIARAPLGDPVSY